MNPFIHVFRTTTSCYLYDVNTDEILRISENTYNYLNSIEMSSIKTIPSEEVTNELLQLESKGYLKKNRIKKSKHPQTDFLEDFSNNAVESLTLQLTQDCNLRCSYCVYSGSYLGRTHTNKKMSKEIATKAMDFFLEHSTESPEIAVGFYGGEPLVEFELLKYCVEYMKERVKTKNLVFTLTTNATMLTRKVADFFVENNIGLMISLDGPKEIHDENRVFTDTGKGSFNSIKRNLKYIKDNFPNYYDKNIAFNSVIATDNYSKVAQFANTDSMFENSTFQSTLVNDTNRENPYSYGGTFIEQTLYGVFISHLTLVKRIPRKKTYKILEPMMDRIGDTRKGKVGKQRELLPEVWHHAGPCAPGIMRLFVSVDGEFYPCEKVCEDASLNSIGNLDEGYNLEKMKQLLNVEDVCNTKCQNCWAYEYCTVCAANTSTNDPKKALDFECERVKAQVEDDFLDYCYYSELGYDFETKIFAYKGGETY